MRATRSKARKTADIVEPNIPLPPQQPVDLPPGPPPPKKRGRPPKAATGDESEVSSPPAKRPKPGRTKGKRPATTSQEKPPLPTRDALPARNVRNDHPAAKANLLPTPRRSSKQVAADREALRIAAEEQIEKAKEATAFLAQMQIDEERFDEDMEADIPQRLSGGAEMRPRDEEDAESFESLSSGSEDDDSEGPALAKQVVSIVIA